MASCAMICTPTAVDPVVVAATVKISGVPPAIVLYSGKKYDRSICWRPEPPAGDKNANTTSPPEIAVAATSLSANE